MSKCSVGLFFEAIEGGGRKQCSGELKHRSDFSYEEWVNIRLRAGLKQMTSVCTNHKLAFGSLFQGTQRNCIDPYNSHRKKVAVTKYCTLSMTLKVQSGHSTVAQNKKTKLVPGAGLCRHCSDKLLNELCNVATPPLSPDIQDQPSLPPNLGVEDEDPSAASPPLSPAIQELASLPLNLGVEDEDPSAASPALSPASQGQASLPSNPTVENEDQNGLQPMRSFDFGGAELRPADVSVMWTSTSPISSIKSSPHPGSGSSSAAHSAIGSFESLEKSTENTKSVGSSEYSKGSAGLAKLNELLALQDISPINKRKAVRLAGYREAKIAKVHFATQRAIKKFSGHELLESQDERDLSELLCQIKERLKTASTRIEWVQLLSVLPRSWSVERVVQEFSDFDVSTAFVRGVKKLVDEQGILPQLAPKQGHGLPQETLDAVKKFYEEDEECVYIYPDTQKCLSVNTPSGKVLKQKRLLLSTISELHKVFKAKNPDMKISFSKFAELRPKYCLLPGSPGTHSQCVCETHQNVELVIEASKIRLSTRDSSTKVKDYKQCLDLIRCCPPTLNCITDRCNDCPGLEPLQELLEVSLDENILSTVTFNTWIKKNKTERCHLETVTKCKEEFIEVFLALMEELKVHDFLAKNQSKYLRDCKETLKEDEVIVLMDFAENYKVILQNSVQSYYWTGDEITVHPFHIIYRDTVTKELQCLNYVVISDYMQHHVPSIYVFMKSMINFVKSRLPHVVKVQYFSDSPTSQYRNFKNVCNLLHHKEDFDLDAEWNYFETSHGKSPCDAIGGTVKRAASRASIMGTIIRNALEFFHFTNEKWNQHGIDSKITTAYVSAEEITSHVAFLEKRFKKALKVPNIMKVHQVKVLSRCKVELREYSNAPKAIQAVVFSVEESNLEPEDDPDIDE